jgi:hypothetical protein
VSGCDIASTGTGGISAGGGDRSGLTASGHRIEHNRIERFSRLARTYSPAIDVSGVGQQVLSNVIADGPHIGIRFAGNDHLIEGNDISRVCQEADDMGAIYAGRDASAYGNVIRRNYVHDIPFIPGMTVGRHAVYLDDQFCGTLIEENVFANIGGVVVLINGGRHNAVLNNVFVAGEGTAPDARVLAAVALTNIGMDRRRYGVAAASGGLPIPAGIDIYSAVYRQKYPQLAATASDEPEKPKFNRVEGNFVMGMRLVDFRIFWGTEADESMFTQFNTIQGNTQIHPGPGASRADSE